MLQNLIGLTGPEIMLSLGVIFLAGLVRGFAGFALSAVVMAVLVVILPPVELIPVCFVLEATATIAMFRGGQKNADMGMVVGLSIGSVIGVPLGLLLTTSISPELSKFVALVVLLTLATLQLFRASPAFLATRAGLYLSGLTAGIVTGLASIGGMVIALYVLARNAKPEEMRASLVMFLAVSMITSGLYYLGFGVMTKLAFTRGIIFAPVVLAGVLIGKALFRPELAGYYKLFCLVLLIVLALAGMGRMLYSSSMIALVTK